MAVRPNIFSSVMGKGNPADSQSCKASAEKARAIGVPEDDSGVVDAFYPMGAKPHNHHLQTADGEIACATWGVGEGTRQQYQEDENKDETIKE